MSARCALPVAAMLALLAIAPAPAAANDGTANCTGFITQPMAITTQGVWCLTENLMDLPTTSGPAIDVQTNNVTIDCNGYSIIHSLGPATSRIGIVANNRTNLTVRGCELRGFNIGIGTNGGSGHLVEDNRFQDIGVTAIYMIGGTNNLIRRNNIRNTGGSTTATVNGVIRADGDIVDNVIDGVKHLSTGTSLVGISASGTDVEVARNYLRGFEAGGDGGAAGIHAAGARMVIADNVVIASPPKSGNGIFGSATALCSGNRVVGFTVGLQGCGHKLDNLTP